MSTLPTDIALRVHAQVASGAFASEEEVLRHAMDSLERRQASLEELRSMVRSADADIAAGRVGTFNVDRTVQAIDRRLASDSAGN